MPDFYLKMRPAGLLPALMKPGAARGSDRWLQGVLFFEPES